MPPRDCLHAIMITHYLLAMLIVPPRYVHERKRLHHLSASEAEPASIRVSASISPRGPMDPVHRACLAHAPICDLKARTLATAALLRVTPSASYIDRMLRRVPPRIQNVSFPVEPGQYTPSTARTPPIGSRLKAAEHAEAFDLEA